MNTVVKKQIVINLIIIGVFILSINNYQAQSSGTMSTTSNTASTELNIIISDLIAIDQGSASCEGIVDFKYVTTSDYVSAKNVIVPSSLIITSSKCFDVKVKADSENFVSGSNFIPVDILKIKALNDGSLLGNLKEITLSTTDQVLVNNEPLGAKKSLNIDYSISASKASTVLLGTAPGTYTQTVTYTATAQ